LRRLRLPAGSRDGDRRGRSRQRSDGVGNIGIRRLRMFQWGSADALPGSLSDL